MTIIKNIVAKSSQITKQFRSSKSFFYSTVILLILLLSLPLGLYLVLNKTNFFPKAAVTQRQGEKPRAVSLGRSIYAPSTLVVKMKAPLQLRTLKDNQPLDLNRADARIGSIVKETMPKALQKFQERHRLNRIEKVFRGINNPAAELQKIRAAVALGRSTGKLPQDEKKFLSVDLSRTYKITLEDSWRSDALDELKKDPEVEFAEPELISTTSVSPSDPLYGKQWAHQVTQTEKAWDITKGSGQVVIAVLDTGVDYSHEDLKSNMLGDCSNGCPEGKGYDFVDINVGEYQQAGFTLISGEDYVDPDNMPADYNGHGTHVAGIVAAKDNNGVGVSGVCPACKIMPVRAGFSMRYGSQDYGMLTESAIALGITYAADHGANVISMSFGSAADSKLEKDAIDYALSKGVILVAAAGNEDTDGVSYPAKYDGVISVAATNEQDGRASFSNYGYDVKVSAPGVNILSTVPKTGSISDPSGYRSLSGTSMATPYISGVAGLILSKNQGLSSRQVEQIIETTVDLPGKATTYIGFGRVNVYRAVLTAGFPPFETRVDSPTMGSIAKGHVDVLGAATGEKYVLYYGSGLYPSSWNTIAEGTQASGLLSKWNISNLSDGLYTLKLSGIKTGLERLSYSRVEVVNTTHDGWPRQLKVEALNGYSGSNVPTLADINGDGIQDIIIHTGEREYILSGDGKDISGWPISSKIIASNIGHGPAAADVDADKKPEVFIAGQSGLTLSWNYPDCFNVFGTNGKYRSGWPTRCLTITGWLLESEEPNEPIIADLDGDGRDEFIVQTDVKQYENELPWSRIYVFRDDGSNFPGWPISFESQPKWGSVISGISAGDVDGDGKKEIIALVYAKATSEEKLYIFGYDGRLKSTSNIKKLDTGFSFSGSPVLADIDNDGKYEIGFVQYGKPIFRKLNGSVVPGWEPTGYSFIGYNRGLVVGDLFKNGSLETVLADEGQTSSIFVYKNNGQLLDGWPKQIDDKLNYSPPTIGDVDGDGYPDILFSTSKGYVYAFDRFGNLVKNFPKIMASRSESGVGIGDINGDGKAEIVSTTTTGRVYVWDTDGIYNPSSLEWPQPFRDARHSNSYPIKLVATPSPTILPTISPAPTQTPLPTPTQNPTPTPQVTASPTPVPVSRNVAPEAAVSVSSTFQNNPDYGWKHVIDGVWAKAGPYEWASNGELAGAWLELNWPTPVTINKINLYDRTGTYDHVSAGTISFDDGSSVTFGTLPDNGSEPLVVTFNPKTVKRVHIGIDKTEGYNAGFAEVEAYTSGISAPTPTSTPTPTPSPTAAPIINLAPKSTQTASSTFQNNPDYGLQHAVDGVWGKAGPYEWASNGELGGAWIQLNWSSPVTVSKVNLYDRVNTYDTVSSGTLLFSDGSSVAFGQLPDDGFSPLTINFSQRTTSWLKVRIDGAKSYNAGFAEVEVYGNNVLGATTSKTDLLRQLFRFLGL